MALNSLGLSMLLAADITPAGSTLTDIATVADDSHLINITTGTTRGVNAYNAFDHFSIESMDTVNLHLPDGTNNLLNVVRGEQATVNGVLNAIKKIGDEHVIGGNVYFACPQGFVVGATGVVNVGSLNVATPTLTWSDDLLAGVAEDANAKGWVESGAIARVNLVPGGLISIEGTLNAIDSIALKAGSLQVGGQLLSGAQFTGAEIDFSDVVNIGTLSSNPGDIQLVAEGESSASLYLGTGAVVRGRNVSLVSTVDSDSLNPLNTISATLNVSGSKLTATEALTLSATATQAPDMSNGVLELRSATADLTVADSTLKAGGILSLDSKATTALALEGLTYAGPARLAIGRAVTTAQAVVTGASSLETTTGDVSVNAQAATTLSAAKSATTIGGASPISGAASFSLSDVTNTATARIGGDTTVSTGGDLRVHARGLTEVATVADATLVGSAGAAASLSLSFVTQEVTSELTGNAAVAKAKNVSVTADGKTTQNTYAQSGVTSDAEASSGLLKDVLAGTGALDEGQQAEVNSLIDKASGALGGGASGSQVAGGVAFAKTGHAVTARMDTTGTVITDGDVTVGTRSLANVDTLASGMTSGGSHGVGAAVAISTGRVANSAELGATVKAGGTVTVTAGCTDMDPQVPEDGGEPLADPDQSFSTKAYSGQSADGVGFAGALAIDNLETLTRAVVTDAAHITAANLSLSATNATTHEAIADGSPEEADYTTVDDLFATYETATGAPADPARSVGVGASVALNFAENETTATLAGEATADLTGDLRLTADSKNTSHTEAVSGTSGGIAIVPVLALSGTCDTTGAVVSAGTGQVAVGGEVSLSSVHLHDNTTLANGDASGGETAAVGMSVSLALTEDENTAAIDRSLAATGAIDVTAESRVSVSSTGIASAGGSSDEPKDGSLNAKVSQFFAFKNAMKKKANKPGKTGKTATKAEASEGGVGFAAAVGITDAESHSQARMGSGAKVSSGGTVTLTNGSLLGASAAGDGAASGGKAGIGAGVAINVATQSGLASIDAGADVQAVSLTLDSKTSDASEEANAFSATATAGAGGSKLAIAGSVAINVVTNTVEAFVDGLLRITEAVMIQASNRSVATSIAGAVASGSSSGSGAAKGMGVGASFSLNDVASKSLARVGGEAQMTGAASLDLRADSENHQITSAAAGEDPEGLAGTDPSATSAVALDAAVALTVDKNETRAMIEAGTGLVTGSVTLVASAVDSNTTESRGDASGDKAAVGASVAIGTNHAITEAMVNRGLTVTGDLSVAATRTGSDTVSAIATAMGLSLARYLNRFKTLEEGIFSGEFGKTSESDTAPEKPQSSKALSKHKAKTGKGGISVAAAVGVNDVDDITRSGIASGVTVKSTGNMEITATEASMFETEGSGAAVSSGLGIGVGVAITSLGKTTEAVVGYTPTEAAGGGKTTVTAGGHLIVAAEARRNARSSEDGCLAAKAVAGAGAKNIGVAGSLAIVNAANTTRAAIEDGLVNAGATTVSATDTERLSAFAGSASAAGSVGIGAGFALLNANSTTQASVGGSVIADSLALSATRKRVGEAPSLDGLKGLIPENHRKASNHYAEAVAGTAGGTLAVSGSFALNHVAETTEAAVADGAKIITTGDTTIQASNQSRTRTFAGAVAGAGNVGVGLSSATTVMASQTDAWVGAGTQVAAGRHIAVKSAFDNDLAAGTISAAGAGTAGVSGTATVTVMKNSTTAATGDHVDFSAGGGLTLSALVHATLDHVAASIAGGGVAGIGGAVSVMTVGNLTQAQTGKTNTLDAVGTLTVKAEAHEEADSLTISGAGGGTVGVAGAVSVATLKSSTKALMGEKAIINSRKRGTLQDVAVSALHDLKLSGIGGSAAGGGVVGVGASADIAMVRTITKAEIGKDSVVSADRDLSVSATSNKEISSKTVAAAGGGTVGVSGATSLLFVGESLSSEAKKAIGGETTGALVDGRAEGSGASVSDDLSATNTTLETQASTGSGVTLRAGRNLTVDALDQTHVAVSSGALAGGLVGLGGDVAIARIRSNTQAFTGATNTLSAGSDLTISAAARNLGGQASTVKALAGAGGLVGVSGALAKLDEANVTLAYTGEGNTIAKAGTLNLSAVESRDVKTEAFGAAVGALSGGVALARTQRDSEVTARLGKNARVGQATETQVGSLNIDAHFGGSATSKATAGSAGVASGAGASAQTSVTSNVLSEMADGAQARVTGDAQVLSANEVVASSTAAGCSIGGIAAGSIDASTVINGTTRSRVGDSAHLNAGNNGAVKSATLIYAGEYDETKEGDNRFSGETAGYGGAGGIVGIIKTNASVTVTTSTTSEVGEGAELTAGDTVDVEAVAGISAVARGKQDSLGCTTGNGITASVVVDNTTTVAIGNGATLKADTVNLTSRTAYLRGTADSFTRTYALGSHSTSTAKVDITTNAKVTVAENAKITGEKAINILARQDNMSVLSIANSKIGGGVTGSLVSNADGTVKAHADVVLTKGATLHTSALTVETESAIADSSYSRHADTDAKTVVKLITTTIKTISKVFSWIPFVGRAVKKIVKWITKTIETIMNSTETRNITGSRETGSSILMDANVSLMGSANPELVIDENGHLEKGAADAVSEVDGELVMKDIINDKIGKVTLSAIDGTVKGAGVISIKNSYDTVNVTNRSNKNLKVGEIQVMGEYNGEPAVEVIAKNSHDFTVISGTDKGCTVSIDSVGGGDVVMTKAVNNEFGTVAITTDTGDILTRDAGKLRATHLNLDAGGNIGSPGNSLNVAMQGGTVSAEADGNLALTVARSQGPAEWVDGDYVLTETTRLERIAAGGALSLELRDGTTRVVTETITHHSEAIQKPSGMADFIWECVLAGLTEDEKTIQWDTAEYTETTPGATGAYEIGTLQGGGDVNVQANNHADFTADRITSTAGSVTVSVPNGSYAVGQVEAQQGSAVLNVRDAITDARVDGTWNVKAKHFNLTSATAGIGAADALEVIQTGAGGALSASAQGAVHLTAVENNLAIGEVAATGPIEITGRGSLLDANDDGVNLTASDIVLTAETGAVNLDVNSDRLTLAAATGIDVEETEGDLNFTRATSASGTVRLVAAGNLVDIDADEEVDVTGDRAELVARNGKIGSAAQAVRIATSEGAMNASEDIYVIADGDLALDGVTAAGRLALTVAGNLSDHNGEAVNISADRVVLSVGGGIDTDTLSGTVDVTAHGDVHLEETEGDLILASVKTGGDVTLGSRKGDLIGRAEGNDVEGTRVTLSAAGSVGTAEDVILIDSHGRVDMAAGTSIHLEEADGALMAGAVTAGTSIHLKADSLANDGDAETRIASDSLVVDTQGSVEVDTRVGSVDVRVASAGDVTLREADGLVINRILLADGDVDLKAGGDILGGGKDTHMTAQNVAVTSTGGGIGTEGSRIVLASNGTVCLDARGDIAVTEAEGLVLENLTSREGTADVLLDAGNLEVTTASAATALNLTAAGGHLSVGSATSPKMRLVTSLETGTVTVDEAIMRDAVVRGGTVRLTARHDGGEGPMTLDVETAGGKASDRINLDLEAAPGVEIINLQAVNADIRVASDDLLLSSARILKRGDIRNAYNHVITDNDNLTPQACTLQLYPEGKRFSAHLMTEFDVTTSARAVNYDDRFITNEFSTENSMVRQAEKELAQAAPPEPQKKAASEPMAMGVVAVAVPVMVAPISVSLDVPPVALGEAGMGVDGLLDVVAP